MSKSLEKYQGPNVPSAGRSSPYPTSRLGAEITLVDIAAEIERASESVTLRTTAQLEIIAEQIQALQAKARAVLERAELDSQLHLVECRFRKTPGQAYHLYGESFADARFSRLSPMDYGGRPPSPFLGSYRLEADMSWTRVLDAAESETRNGRDPIG